VNLAFDVTLTEPNTLLDRYDTLTGWARALSRTGASVHVLQRFSTAAMVRRDDVAYEFISDDDRPLPSPSWTSAPLARALQLQNPDIIHINGLMFPAAVRHLRDAVPHAAIVVQDHAGLSVPGWFARMREPSWRCLRAAEAWSFTAAEHAAPWRDARLLGDARVLEIPEASTQLTPVDREEARRLTGIDANPSLLWVGRLNANKDPLTVLSGIERVFADHSDARCWMIYSDAPLEADVRSRINASPVLRDRVTLVRHVPHDRMALHYSAADVYVSGSHHEGSGYALIESMACGVIPAVTNIPSFRAIAADCGVRWQIGDADSLAAALSRAFGLDHIAERARIRDRFLSRLSWDAVGARTLAAYRELVEERE